MLNALTSLLSLSASAVETTVLTIYAQNPFEDPDDWPETTSEDPFD